MPGAESLPARARGHHTIFLGMAPGVGKTYRMLENGQAELAAGRDILLGRSRPARGLGRLRVPLPQRLMAGLPAVDVRIVADRSTRHEATP